MRPQAGGVESGDELRPADGRLADAASPNLVALLVIVIDHDNFRVPDVGVYRHTKSTTQPSESTKSCELGPLLHKSVVRQREQRPA